MSGGGASDVQAVDQPQRSTEDEYSALIPSPSL